jgi:hypothetical protein
MGVHPFKTYGARGVKIVGERLTLTPKNSIKNRIKSKLIPIPIDILLNKLLSSITSRMSISISVDSFVLGMAFCSETPETGKEPIDEEGSEGCDQEVGATKESPPQKRHL